ncbi:unnamed protein product [Clonostachys rosea]|uniref:Uncharacterized protein n=1 Tax=Bionectria ochroleuca TaxID=29856 RepID=A0ABY6V1A0_BIOOC|nr:unnamed protein product [Clonostachys rosea]
MADSDFSAQSASQEEQNAPNISQEEVAIMSPTNSAGPAPKENETANASPAPAPARITMNDAQWWRNQVNRLDRRIHKDEAKVRTLQIFNRRLRGDIASLQMSRED